jgi:uncharacterized membrane protein YidH (DUF202 family)
MKRMILGGIITVISSIVLSVVITKNAIEINHLSRYNYVITEVNNDFRFRLALIAVVILIGVGTFIWGVVSKKRLVKQRLS